MLYFIILYVIFYHPFPTTFQQNLSPPCETPVQQTFPPQSLVESPTRPVPQSPQMHEAIPRVRLPAPARGRKLSPHDHDFSLLTFVLHFVYIPLILTFLTFILRIHYFLISQILCVRDLQYSTCIALDPH